MDNTRCAASWEQLLDNLMVQHHPQASTGCEHLQLTQLRGAQVAAHARGRRNHQLAHQVLKALRPKQRREELGALRAAACLQALPDQRNIWLLT